MIEFSERPLLNEGLPYTIELNTCTIHEKVVYLGSKTLNGKKLLVFENKEGRQISINPSFHTYIMEEEFVKPEFPINNQEVEKPQNE